MSDLGAVSRELSQELYEATQWVDTDKWWRYVGALGWAVEFAVSPLPSGFYDHNNFIPAYDMDYLLQKLPNILKDGHHAAFLIVGATSETSWAASYEKLPDQETYPKEVCGIADTPQDAIAKLAIELEGLKNKS